LAAQVPHHGGLLLDLGGPAVSAQHAALVEQVDIGVAAGREERAGRAVTPAVITVAGGEAYPIHEARVIGPAGGVGLADGLREISKSTVTVGVHAGHSGMSVRRTRCYTGVLEQRSRLDRVEGGRPHESTLQRATRPDRSPRSEAHTSELQS